MTAPDTTGYAISWPQAIRRYTLYLVALITVLGLAVTGYVFWEKQRDENLLLIATGYHLASAFHAAAARDEMFHILEHVADRPAVSGSEAQEQIATDHDFDLNISVSLVRERIAAIGALQDRFADPRFTSLTARIRNAFAALERGSSERQASGAEPAGFVNDLRSLMTALDQAERLHVIIYQELTAEHERQQGWNLAILCVFMALVFAVGFLCVRKGLQAIAGVAALQNQNEVTLRVAKSEAESASAAKSEFLASMSHELRTPLNAILGYAQLLSLPLLSLAEEKRATYAKNIQAAAEHLLALIEDILDLSKIESGEDLLSEAEFELSEAIEDAGQMVRGMAEKQSVKVTYDYPRGVTLLADRRRLTQILVNLLSNATKFTKAGGRISLAAALDATDALAITVTDSGIGIPREEIPRLFEPFTQVRRSSHLTHDGTGLGLPLSRKLAELHGGTIALESEVGVGTKVTIVLPSDRIVRRPRNPALEANQLPMPMAAREI